MPTIPSERGQAQISSRCIQDHTTGSADGIDAGGRAVDVCESRLRDSASAFAGGVLGVHGVPAHRHVDPRRFRQGKAVNTLVDNRTPGVVLFERLREQATDGDRDLPESLEASRRSGG